MDRIKPLYRTCVDLATNPRHTLWLSYVLLVADALLCVLIIQNIPYTEIDFETYMHQVSLYREGERDYLKIKGPSGPIVYPGAYVYIYSAIYRITSDGIDIRRAQYLFMGVYLGVLSLVMACYRRCKVPPYILPLLILSKRLHSVWLLRLFNDCFVAGALFTVIYFYQRRVWTVGSVAFSFGVGVKMTLLLATPAVGMVLLQVLPFKRALNAAFLMAQVQFALAVPFFSANVKGYLSRSFELTRQFLYKWTVNWRFVGEDLFLSREFAISLLVANVTLLAIFIATRWTRPSGISAPGIVGTIFKPIPPKVQQRLSLNVTPDFIMTSVLSSMFIGLLCARSLHYQFFAYIAWSSPFLLWRSGMPPYLVYAIWAAQEWAWNVFPSTDTSSKVVVGCLAIQVLSVWWGTREDFADETPVEVDDGSHKHSD